MSYLAASMKQRLNDHEARKYATQIEAKGQVRATVFSIGFGVSSVEIRPLWGQPQRPATVLRTAEECARLLAGLEEVQ